MRRVYVNTLSDQTCERTGNFAVNSLKKRDEISLLREKDNPPGGQQKLWKNGNDEERGNTHAFGVTLIRFGDPPRCPVIRSSLMKASRGREITMWHLIHSLWLTCAGIRGVSIKNSRDEREREREGLSDRWGTTSQKRTERGIGIEKPRRRRRRRLATATACNWKAENGGPKLRAAN